MQRQKQTNLVQIGGGLIVLGIIVVVLQFVAHLMLPFAALAVLVGVVLLVIGLVSPGPKY